MAPPSVQTINLALAVVDDLAGNDLPRAIARLYSHHTRLRESQSGLPTWSTNEANERLHDVMRLIEAASIQRESGDNDDWRIPMRRAGEILEWLSLSNTGTTGIPISLLSAAAYQISGYPARASGLLKAETEQGEQSRIIGALLKADFVTLLERIGAYWAESLRQPQTSGTEKVDPANALPGIIVNETVSALGILCAYMRWGDDTRLEKALEKLAAVSDVLVQGYNPYSWLLAKLCVEASRIYTQTSLRRHLQELLLEVNQTGRTVLERYYRQKLQSCQALAWPSQIRGISELARNQSFALCTPTGSGKTTIAELAILQSLFFNEHQTGIATRASLVIYIVPSRALAVEVEARLSKVLKSVSTQEIIVTGLYGGTDWGPTDSWLTNDQKTVLICTFEKAEALLKFLGVFFINRVSLIIIDEAHNVQFNNDQKSLQKAENRPLRLESLGARLFTYIRQNQTNGRIIALSAVAAGVEQALAQWVTHERNASSIRTPYRSTRQLIGRLECLDGRGFEIRYDALDGAGLEVQGMETAERPYIPNPFPAHPGAPSLERENTTGKKLRPYLFWAAVHLAAPDERGQQRAVLISIAQDISGYAEDFLSLLDSNAWIQRGIPPFFHSPSDERKVRIWNRCLAACEDYFDTESREYRLLQRGIVIHYSNMPGLLARLLIEVVSERIVTLVMATSTLSEGINLPFFLISSWSTRVTVTAFAGGCQ